MIARKQNLWQSRWTILAVVWAAFFITFVDRLAWANVATSVGASLGLQVAALNVFVTAFYVGYVLSNLGTSFLTDRLGGRWMLTMALLPLGLFTFLFGFTTSVSFGLALQALMGAAAGADYAAGVKLITAWFGRRDRGRAMGLYMTAPTLGVIITNAIVPYFLKSFDWSGVYEIFGVATIGIGVVCAIVLRDRPPAGAVEASARASSDPPASPLALLGNRNLIFLTLAGFGGIWGTFGFVFWVNALLVRGHGMSAIEAGNIVALFGFGALVGNPLMGVLSDWLGMRKVPVIVCLVCFVVMLLLFGGFETVAWFWIAAPVLGITAFVYQPLLGAMVAEAAGLALAGTATGVTNACWQLGAILVPLVVGVIFQLSGSFLAAFMALAFGPLVAALSMWFVREAPRGSQAR